MHQTLGQHLLAEFRGCDPEALNDIGFIEASMREAARVAGVTVMNASFHQFGPQGVSGVLVLAESHLSVHTWPEHGYAATDIYTCGDQCFPERAQASLARALGAASHEILHVERGKPGTPAGMRVIAHEQHDALGKGVSAELGEALAQSRQRRNRA